MEIYILIIFVIFILIIWEFIRIICYNRLRLQLSPRKNGQFFYPGTVEEVQFLINTARQNNRKISVVGAGYSMGGQCYYDDTGDREYHPCIDMRNLCGILDLDIQHKNPTITVQAGCLWRDIIQVLSGQGYSVECMQSYCDFSVGGSISVNCHGQDLKFNPIISSIKSLDLCNANGRIITLTPSDDLFYYVVGGYGLFGIIISATLFITKDIDIQSEIHTLDTIDYEYYLNLCLNNDIMIFHSARPNITDFSKCVVINYIKSRFDPYSLTNNTIIKSERSLKEGLVIGLLSNFPDLRKYKTSMEEKHHEYTTRNKFMSATVKSLETPLYMTGNFILQEYFIPFDRTENPESANSEFYIFLMGLEKIIKKYNVNLINISLRYVKSNLSILSYSPKSPSLLFSILILTNINR